MINTRLTTNTLLDANQAVPVGTIIHKSGCGISASGSVFSVDGVGYYRIIANVSVTPTADAAVTLSLNNNGAAIATASALPSAAGASVNLTLIATIRNRCACIDNLITITTDSAATITESDVIIERM